MADKTRIPIHRNPVVRAIIIQLVLLTLVIFGINILVQNAIFNLEKSGAKTSFDFLFEVAPFNVGFSPFLTFELGKSTYLQVFLISIQNTILVSILGVVAATFLGFLIGIMRLSPNWLISRFALVYIETMRNIPLLLQIIFWNFAIFLAFLPNVKDSLSLFSSIYLNKRGLYLPKPVLEDTQGLIIVLIAVVIAIIGAVILSRWDKKRHDETGKRFPAILVGFLGVIVVAIVVFIAAGSPLIFEFPTAGRFNFSGGLELPLPLFSLWFALTVYTAAFIAENVRSGIQAVSHGQTEAAQALGLSRKDMLQKVIIPQAMRIIIPPTINQYLNLTKNSSLATAVAYEEIVALFAGIALNQTGQSITIIFMTMAVYITLSIFTSVVLNLYNRSVQLVER